MYGGSGTTGIGCVLTGREYLLIDDSEEYCQIARRRIAYFQEHGNVMPKIEQVSKSGLKQEKLF
jgi:DNA modification methylase